MVDVSQDVIIREEDCHVTHGIKVSEISENGQVIEKFSDRLRGRFLVGDVVDADTGEVLLDVYKRQAKDKYYGKTLRKNFARHEEVMPMPNLLEIQKKSYQEFLDTGLREVFNDVGAITDYQGNLELTFIDYKMCIRDRP